MAGFNDDLSAVSGRSVCPAGFRIDPGQKRHAANKGDEPEEWHESLRVKEQAS